MIDSDVLGELDELDELEAELTAMGLGGRLTAASAGHAATVLLGVYFTESMLEGEALAILFDTV